MGVKRVTVLVSVAAKRKGTTVAQGVLVLHSHAKSTSKWLTSTPTIQNSDESSSSVSNDSGDEGSVYNDKEVLYLEELDKEVDEIMVDIIIWWTRRL